MFEAKKYHVMETGEGKCDIGRIIKLVMRKSTKVRKKGLWGNNTRQYLLPEKLENMITGTI